MTKRRVVLVGLWLLLAFPVAASAQGLLSEPSPTAAIPFRGAGGSGWFSGITSLPGLNWIEAGDIKVVPSAEVGYKKIGLNFNLDIPVTQLLSPFLFFRQYGSLLDLYPLDIKIQSADLAVGSFRLDAWITPFFGLFGSVSANIPRTVTIQSNEGPSMGQIPPQERSWTGSRFQWSEFEVGGSYNINPAVGLAAGIRFDRVSVRFSEPEPLPGYYGIISFPPPTIQGVTFPNYSGDLNTFFTIPYIGCEILGPYFKGSVLIGSASASLRLPLDLTHAGPYLGFFIPPVFGVGRRDLSEQAEYTFKNAGLFVEAGSESNFSFGIFNATLWAKGSWLRIRGDGDLSLAGQSSLFAFLGPLTFRLPELFSATSSGTSTLSQYTFDVGLSGTFNF